MQFLAPILCILSIKDSANLRTSDSTLLKNHLLLRFTSRFFNLVYVFSSVNLRNLSKVFPKSSCRVPFLLSTAPRHTASVIRTPLRSDSFSVRSDSLLQSSDLSCSRAPSLSSRDSFLSSLIMRHLPFLQTKKAVSKPYSLCRLSPVFYRSWAAHLQRSTSA